ncbi:MAG: sensor domain-containing diguanylate cyclase [Rhodocyclaceae bacterium]|nr:sensor domain-containing diguanylate cyclase [Rhodocyclaceae bacterium]
MPEKLPSLLNRVVASRRFALLMALLTLVFNVALGELFVSIEQRETEARRNIDVLSYASALRARIERELNALLYLNSGLGSYLVVRNDNINAREINDILAVLHRSTQHVRNFGIAVGDRLTYVYPLAGNEKAVGLKYRDLPDQWPVIEQVIAGGKPGLAGPIDLVQGGRGLIYRVPLLIDERYWGLLSTVIDADSLFQAVFQGADDHNFTYALRSKSVMGIEARALIGDQSLFEREHPVTLDIEIPGGYWSIAVEAKPKSFLLGRMTALRIASLLIGALLAWLIFVLLRHRSELAHLVLYDTLTGLPNRRLLEDRHEMIIARMRRHPPEHQCTLMFIDLDGFKLINDHYGHKAGDALLQEVANRLRKVLRTNDTVARWGGDEFVILIEDVSPDDVEALNARLHETIEEAFKFGERRLKVRASVGIATYPPEGTSLEELLKTADQRMYAEKTLHKSERTTAA